MAVKFIVAPLQQTAQCFPLYFIRDLVKADLAQGLLFRVLLFFVDIRNTSLNQLQEFFFIYRLHDVVFYTQPYRLSCIFKVCIARNNDNGHISLVLAQLLHKL